MTVATPASPAVPRIVRLPAPLVRLVTLLALVAFGAGHWMGQLEPTASGMAVATVLLAGAVALALLGLGRLPTAAPRRLGLAALVVAATVLALLIAGLPTALLVPNRWGLAVDEVVSGLDGLAGARVPYRGIDEGLRLVIPLGGTLLGVLAAGLAFWPRATGRLGRPAAALVALVTLYAVPAVGLAPDDAFVRGAVFALLLLLFWRGEQLELTQARAAGLLVAAAAACALLVAPLLDGDGPWFDYTAWVEDNAGGRTESFNWEHDYAALLWPRDGREMVRVKAAERSYWKVQNLDGFDGRRWDISTRLPSGLERTSVALGADRARWTQKIRVSVRALSSAQLPLAGSTLAVDFPDRDAEELTPGVFSVGRELRRGDAYEATVYTPDPSRRQLDTAGTAYGMQLRGRTTFDVQLPRGRGAPPQRVTLGVPGFKAGLRTRTWYGPQGDAEALIARSDLDRIYRLSQRLLADSRTPYDYVQEIQRFLGAPGFTYDEAPPLAARTLDGFLFNARAGFCQQYSGSMALLLRMGGVPARVVTGFAPGAFDRDTDEYVVRDVDAHSWVEAYFPGIGWVTFDPTPAAAPPRAQGQSAAPSAGNGDVRDLGTRLAPGPGTPAAPTATTGGTPWVAIAGTGAGAAVLLAGLVLLVRRRRTPRPVLAELEAVLRGVGHPVGPGETLEALERRHAGSPAVVEYLRALSAARFGRGGAGPTASQRRRLRRALTRGRSPRARLRAWRALPPRRG